MLGKAQVLVALMLALCDSASALGVGQFEILLWISRTFRIHSLHQGNRDILTGVSWKSCPARFTVLRCEIKRFKMLASKQNDSVMFECHFESFKNIFMIFLIMSWIAIILDPCDMKFPCCPMPSEHDIRSQLHQQKFKLTSHNRCDE